MSLEVVYQAHPANVARAVRLLEEKGLHPVVLDHPSAIVVYASMGTYRVRIAVPQEEAEAARGVLADMELAALPRVEALGRQFTRQLALSVLGAAATAAGLWLACGRWDDVPWWPPVAVGAGCLILLGNAGRNRPRRGPGAM